MAAIAQTIAIVDKSGKVVSTSKQLKNVFKEAKSAYRERKAGIKADRKAKEDVELRKAIAAMSVTEDSRSDYTRSARPGHSRRHSSQHHGLPSSNELHYSTSSFHSETSSPRSSSARPPRSTHQSRQHGLNPRSTSPSASASRVHRRGSRELVRRHTDMDLVLPPRRPHTASRSNSTSQIDMDLAYGDYHPESLALARPAEQQELSSLVTKVKMLLDEAKCAEASVTAVIRHLHKNPDAMAAVALTLAEISNIVSKMSPIALTSLKAGAPAVFALLAAPEFLIAGGVAVGVTIVMFGGYKIIKKIKAKNAAGKEAGMDEMLELGSDVDRIENWRRGIADWETSSVATSVEGEFITPMAAGMKSDPRLSEVRAGGKKQKKSKKSRSFRSDKSSKAGSVDMTENEKHQKALVKAKKPSPLRRMFQ